MSKKLSIIFICIIGTIAFAAVCISQTFPRDSTGHYLCWLSAIIGIIWIILQVNKMDHPAE